MHYNIAATLAICFNLLTKVSSFRAVCILYFSCNRINDSAEIPKTASKMSAEVVVIILYALPKLP